MLGSRTRPTRFGGLFAALAVLAAVFACRGSPQVSPEAGAPTANAPAPVAPGPLLEVPFEIIPTPSAESRAHIDPQQAACTAADGTWRCRRVKKVGAFGATQAPVIPSSWSVAAWWLDPSNVSTTASDENDCVSAATACLTYGEISMHRWGTISPVLQQVTTINDLSAWPANLLADPVSLRTRGNLVAFVGALGVNETIASGALAGVVPKALPNTLLQATLTAPVATGELVHNTTHDSYAWTLTALGGSAFELTQPMTMTPPFFAAGAAVNTWANGDAYTVFAPDRLNLGDASIASGTPPFLAMHSIFPSFGSGPFMGSFVGCKFNGSGVSFLPTGKGTTFLVNSYIGTNDVIGEITGGGPNVIVIAGAYTGGNNMQGAFQISKDFIFNNANGYLWGGIVMDTLWARSTVTVVDGTIQFQAGSTFAGNQTLNVTKHARVQWPAAQTATATFVQTAATPFLLNGLSTACSLVAATGVVACSIPLTPTTLDALVGPSGFGGNAWSPFGARITNAAN